MLDKAFLALCRIPGFEKGMWRRWYGYLARRYREADWTFMNYGFEDPHTSVRLDPADEPNRYCIQLYNFVAGAEPLGGLNVLEVGSGRGGGASYVARYLKPAKFVGVDISDDAVRLCTRLHHVSGLSFQQGDAERLPFDNDVFDAVINVESSHCYPHISTFFAEVARVLKPGGHFLYADFRKRQAIDEWRRVLQGSGLHIVSETDMTPNVVKALDLEDQRKVTMLNRMAPGLLRKSMLNFAAIRGSEMYDAFCTSEIRYLRFVATKNPSNG